MLAVVGAGEGDFLFLTTCPGPDPFDAATVVLRFLRLGSEGFMKLRNQVKNVINSHCKE